MCKQLILKFGAFFLLLTPSLLLFASDTNTRSVLASEVIATEKSHPPLSRRGADSCLKCHDDEGEFPVMDIFATKHGQSSDPHAPFAQLQCESCHGPGGDHVKKKKKDKPGGEIINFSKGSKTPVSIQNKQCLSCHQDDQRSHWQDNAHERNDLTCVSCHQVHVKSDPVLNPKEEVQVCVSCHKKRRADIHKRSNHPLDNGEMSCTSCHSPHGSGTEGDLNKPNLNQTCYSCHAEKRGPYLWQHAPVEEDCTTCHQPHGSLHEDLLVKRSELLCRGCHSPAGHPSLAPSGTGLPNNTHQSMAKFLVGKNCLNCHAQIHGSNHPSGVKFLR